MLSEEQIKEKLENVRKSVEAFLGEKKADGTFEITNKTIYDVSKETGLTTSSIQRYLNDYNYIKALYPSDYVLRIAIIESRLSTNKKEGTKKGGTNYSLNNEAIKGENGYFSGSRKK